MKKFNCEKLAPIFDNKFKSMGGKWTEWSVYLKSLKIKQIWVNANTYGVDPEELVELINDKRYKNFVWVVGGTKSKSRGPGNSYSYSPHVSMKTEIILVPTKVAEKILVLGLP